MQYELPSGPATGPATVTVSQLLRNVRDLLERRFPLMWVRGELSNLSRAPSGHCYFTLKDDGAQVDCVMFKSRFAALDWEPANGAQVEARALVSLYEPRGRFQLTVEARNTFPVESVHSPALAKLSAPSTTTPGPCAWITNGVPAAPEAGTVTCSR